AASMKPIRRILPTIRGPADLTINPRTTTVRAEAPGSATPGAVLASLLPATGRVCPAFTARNSRGVTIRDTVTTAAIAPAEAITGNPPAITSPATITACAIAAAA